MSDMPVLGEEELDSLVEPEASELAELDFVRSEVNLLVFPFFALTRKTLRRKLRTEFRATVNRDGDVLEIAWTVSANPEYGYPGLFDREVHRAVEQIITEMLNDLGRVENPIPLGSLYSLCERMGLEKDPQRQAYGGWQYRQIRRALERITTTTIKSEGTFYHKGEKRWVAQVFHLYDAVVFRGEVMRDGSVADTNYVYLSDLYLQSINNFYVKPLDFNYQRSLRPIASRLYEILGVKFYGLRHSPQAAVCFRYSTLTQLLPVTRCRYLSDARKQLDPSHKELVDTGFLSAYEWRASAERGDWVLYYWPGERARREIQMAQGQWLMPARGLRGLPPIDDGKAAGEPVREEQLVALLVARKVSEKTARKLVATRPAELIEAWVEAIEYARAEDKAAFLVQAIREGWQVPEQYLQAKAQQEHMAKEEARRQAQMQEEEKRRQAREQMVQELEQLYESLPAGEREEVDRLAVERVPAALRARVQAQLQAGELTAASEALLRNARHEVLRERYQQAGQRKER